MLILAIFVPPRAAASITGAASTQGATGSFALGANGAVDEASGAATISIPIDVPRARGAAQPDLALVYNSAHSLGDIALGWSLRTPAIERTGVVSGDPESAERIRYAFDGQPLVYIGPVQGTACPAPNCTEQMPSWASGGYYYRLHDDAQYARFFSFPGGSWRVQFTSGEIWEFGVPLIAPGLFRTDSNGAVDVLPGLNTMVRFNIVRKYELHSGSTPVNLVTYAWQHFSGDPSGVLTDIFDTPPVGNISDLDTYAHHVKITYSPYAARFSSETQPTWIWSTPAWRRTPLWGATRIDVTAASAPGSARNHVRSYHLNRAPGAANEASGEAKSNRGWPFLYSLTMQGRSEPPAVEVKRFVIAIDEERGGWEWTVDPTGPMSEPVTFEYSAGLHGPSVVQELAPVAADGGPDVPAGTLGTPSNTALFDVDGDGLADLIDGVGTSSQRLFLNRRNVFYSGSLEYARLTLAPTSMTTFLAGSGAVSIGGSIRFTGRTSGFWSIGTSSNQTFYVVTATQAGPYDWRFVNGATTDSFFRPSVFLAGDIDADGIPDYVQKNDHFCLSRRNTTNKNVQFGGYSGGSGCYLLSLSTPPFLSSQPTAFQTLADVNGDGFLDFVRSRPMSMVPGMSPTSQFLEYFPGNGRKFFCEPRTSAGAPEDGCVRRPDGCTSGSCDSSVPLGFSFDPAAPNQPYFMFGDVTGDGRADLLRLQEVNGGLDIFVHKNVDGKRFENVFETMHVEDPNGQLAKAFLADMDGSGVSSLVLVGQGSVRVLDFHYQAPAYEDSPRPGLLRRMTNGAGATTEFSYKTATTIEAEQIADPARRWHNLGPWARHSPKPIILTTQVKRSSNLPPYYESETTAYDYRDPAYDPWLGRVIGFERSLVTQLGDADQPSLSRETTYFYGDCPPKTGTTLCPRTTEEYTYRGLLGRPILVENFDSNGAYFDTTVYHYRQDSLLTGHSSDGRSTGRVYTDRVDTFIYDAGATGGSYTLTFPVVSDTLLRTVTVRNDAGVQHLRTQREIDPAGNTTVVIENGRIRDTGAQIDRPMRRGYFPFTPAGAASWAWRTIYSSTTYDPGGETARLGPDPARSEIWYDYDSLARLYYIRANLSGTLPLVRSHQDPAAQVAPAPPNAAADTWTTPTHYLGYIEYDAAGNIIRSRDPYPWGRCRQYSYAAGGYALYPDTVSELLGPSCGATQALTTQFTWDAGFGVAASIRAPNQAVSSVVVDGFGRPIRVNAPNPFTGAPQAELDLWYGSTMAPAGARANTVSLRRASDGLESVYYFDGFERPILALHGQGNGQWLANGLARRNARGLPTHFSRPWEYSGSTQDQSTLLTTPSTGFAHITRDAVGRVLTESDSSRTRNKYIHHPLALEHWDAENLDPTSDHSGTPTWHFMDGHGRVERVETTITEGGSADRVIRSFSYTARGALNGVAARHTAGPEQYSRWIRYDSLGRMVENSEPHSVGFYSADWSQPTSRVWRYAYDHAGRLVGTSDPRGCGENFHYDNAGRLVAEDYSPCRIGQPAYSAPNLTTGDGTEAFYVYQTTGVAAGRLSAIRDRASETGFSYDARGRVSGQTRRIAKPGTPSDIIAQRYASHVFQRDFAYDARDRLVEATTGAESPEFLASGDSAVQFEYSSRGLLSKIDSSYGTLVDSISYDPDGRIRSRVLGDVAHTTESFEYDPVTRNLQRHLIERAAPDIWANPSGGYTSPPAGSTDMTVLVHDSVIRDAVGNVLSINDARSPSEWPSGAKPISRNMAYDDFYRLRQVDYTTTDTTHVNPFAHEQASGDTAPVPQLVAASRPAWQRYTYDWFGSTTSSTDNEGIYFDRSIGTILNDTAGGRPGRLRSAATAAGVVDASYDDAGNMTALIVGRDASCASSAPRCNHLFAYEWDEVGHLSSARRWDYATRGAIPSSPAAETSTPDVAIAYGYGVGGRVLKTVSDGTPTGTRHTVDVFPSLRLRNAAYDNSASTYEQNAETETVYLAGVARLQYAPDAPSTSGDPVHVLLQLGDRLGSTSVTIDRETSELVERVTYQPYGGTESDYRPERWGSFREEHRFTGKEDDSEVGLTYFGARYYSPALGRWLSPDPLTVHGVGADMNPYAYVSGRTFNSVDPLGLSGNCTENPGCSGGTASVFGDGDGWVNAGRDAAYAMGDAAKWAGEGIADVATSVFDWAFGSRKTVGGKPRPSRGAEVVEVAVSLSPAGPANAMTTDVINLVGAALAPGAKWTVAGYGKGVLHAMAGGVEGGLIGVADGHALTTAAPQWGFVPTAVEFRWRLIRN